MERREAFGKALRQLREQSKLTITDVADAGSEVHHEEVEAELAFLTDWLRRKNISASTSKVVPVRGDSMAPFLVDGDVVLIDTADTVPIKQYKVYAVQYGEHTLVKRLYTKPDGALVMVSDNPNFRPHEQIIRPEEIEQGLVRIIGRMRWRAGEGEDF